MNLFDKKIAIIGLGYVGLPLAIEFGKKFKVLGFDINQSRIKELNLGIDRTEEADLEELKIVMNLSKSTEFVGLSFSANVNDLINYDVFIVTVPTPIDKFKLPDLAPLLKASEMLGKILKKGDIVIFESTVYPGCTEEDCVPVLEKYSGLKFNVDFFCGYSPERINPGDKVNTLTKIKKVTSGSTSEIADLVDKLYSSIILAGTHKAPSIKVAEASKAIENAQRDVNISFVNELAMIFYSMGIDTNDVLEASGTKWNFLNFQPGLVGGHCIGVDPYYLAYRAKEFGCNPKLILAGREISDFLPNFIAKSFVEKLLEKGNVLSSSRVLILGFSFKENCPDIRNTKVYDLLLSLKSFGLTVDVYDPVVNNDEVFSEYSFDLISSLNHKYAGVILAVKHKIFKDLDICLLKSNNNSIIYDLKNFLPRSLVDIRL